MTIYDCLFLAYSSYLYRYIETHNLPRPFITPMKIFTIIVLFYSSLVLALTLLSSISSYYYISYIGTKIFYSTIMVIVDCQFLLRLAGEIKSDKINTCKILMATSAVVTKFLFIIFTSAQVF